MGSSSRVKIRRPRFGSSVLNRSDEEVWVKPSVKPYKLHSLYQHDKDKIPIFCQPHQSILKITFYETLTKSDYCSRDYQYLSQLRVLPYWGQLCSNIFCYLQNGEEKYSRIFPSGIIFEVLGEIDLWLHKK